MREPIPYRRPITDRSSRMPRGQRLFAASVVPVVLGVSLSGLVSSVPGALMAILGLGLIILIHEFGHFAAAKACNVYVEAFAIGFGPAFASRKVGETEYRLNILPLGGYVKMLGQDDMDSSQMTSEEVAENPRAYSAKSVPQRMVIISAGVIMNIITAVMFYMVAFGLGVERIEPLVGSVQAPMPAWVAGLRPGDRITSMDGRKVANFSDVIRGTALSNGTIDLEGVRLDGKAYKKTISPKFGGETRQIGVGLMNSTELRAFEDNVAPADPMTPAAKALTNSVPKGTKVVRVGAAEISSYLEIRRAFDQQRDQPVTIRTSNSEGESAEFQLEPMPFRDLGFHLDIGKVTGIQSGSVAEANGIRVGDRLARIDGLGIGKELDPLRVSDYLSARAGDPVTIRLVRLDESGQQSEEDISVTPDDRLPWETPPRLLTAPVTVPSLGLTFEILPTVLSVSEGGPAAAAGIEQGDKLASVKLSIRDGVDTSNLGDGDDSPVRFEIGKTANWPFVFWQLQELRYVDVELTYYDGSTSEVAQATIETRASNDWWLPTDRGLKFGLASYEQTATSFGDSLELAMTETGSKVTEIYLTLRALFTGNVGVKGLRGPIGILGIAKDVAESGWSPFLTFLGYISVNLAVLNFLPIPVLDGGHMVLLAYEGLTRKKPSEKFVIAVTNVGLLLLLTLFLSTMYFDIGRFFE